MGDENVKEIVRFMKEVQASGHDIFAVTEALLTPAEIGSISQRLAILDALARGVSQRRIAEDLGVGIATVTRGSRALQEKGSLLKAIFPREAEAPLSLDGERQAGG